jgi:hypothetical protein
MYYSGFDDRITKHYGIIIDHWPLPTFCSPSDLKTVNEVQILYNAFDTGATNFRKLSSEELEKFCVEQAERSLQEREQNVDNREQFPQVPVHSKYFTQHRFALRFYSLP